LEVAPHLHSPRRRKVFNTFFIFIDGEIRKSSTVLPLEKTYCVFLAILAICEFEVAESRSLLWNSTDEVLMTLCDKEYVADDIATRKK
jgi:hypothetical protein